MSEDKQSLDRQEIDPEEIQDIPSNEEVSQDPSLETPQAGGASEEMEPADLEANEPEDLQAQEVNQLKAQVEQLEDQTLRLQAEMANIQRSNQRDRQEAAKYRSQFLAKPLVEAMDNMERALAIEAKSEEGQAIHKGVEMVYEQILKAFKDEHIEQIDPINQAFDPNFHQAVTTQPVQEGQKADQVVKVLQKGYVLNDRVIRPAIVIVSA